MSSRTERYRHRERGWCAMACAALLGASACSGDREIVVARFNLDAGNPDAVTPCIPNPGDAHVAEDMGLDLYFILDHSSNTFSEWGYLAASLGNLFSMRTPEFVGMGAGFGVFPMRMPPQQACVETDCGTAPSCECVWHCGCAIPDWQTPPTVACPCQQWASSCEEEDYAPAFSTERATEDPYGFLNKLLGLVPATPRDDDSILYPAVVASLSHRNDWEFRNRNRNIVQVLIAESLRFARCDNNKDDVSDVEDLLRPIEAPKTYVVGVNVDTDDPQRRDFEALAAAGHTERAMYLQIRTSRPDITAVQNALAEIIRKIRATDGRCEFLLPTSVANFDPTKVNLMAGSGGSPFPKVANRAACAGEPQGWYYDSDESADPTVRPRRILACEGACRALRGNQDGGVSGQDSGQSSAQDAGSSAIARIQLGCPTVVTRPDAGP